MRASDRKMMKLKQGKVQSGADVPGAGDGYEGQVQVREVNGQPVLFARLNGRWIETPMMGTGDFFIPKAHTANVILPSIGNKSFYQVPNFISIPNILSISVIAKYVTSVSTLYTQMPATDQTLTNFNGCMLTVQNENRRVFFANLLAPFFRGVEGRLTILYK